MSALNQDMKMPKIVHLLIEAFILLVMMLIFANVCADRSSRNIGEDNATISQSIPDDGSAVRDLVLDDTSKGKQKGEGR